MSLIDTGSGLADWKVFQSAAGRLRYLLSAEFIKPACVALFAAVALATAALAVLKPEYNWDMAPYVAVSLEDRISDPEALHAEAWGAIRAEAPEAQWYKLTAGNAYNLHQWEHPEDFFSQLTMYRVKIGYIEAIRWFDGWFGPVGATMAIDALSALAIGGLLLWWMIRHRFVEAAPLLVALLLLAGYFDMALIATPDLMMAVFGLTGIYLVLKDRAWTAVPFLLAMYLVRPDGIIFLFALLLAALAFGLARLPALLTFAVALLAYGPIADYANHPGWWPHYVFSNLELQNSMDGFAPAFSVVDYLHGLVRGAWVALRMNNWPMLMLALLAGWLLLAGKGRLTDRRASMMLTALVLCFLGKFVTFPLPDDRVYFMFVAAFGAILLEAWKPRLSLAGRSVASA